MRYLTEHQLSTALGRGATVEQRVDSAAGTFAWLSACRSGETFALTLHHVHDEGNDDFYDVYEFAPVDEDETDGKVLGAFNDVAALLRASAQRGARADHWVNEGLIQDEYADLRS